MTWPCTFPWLDHLPLKNHLPCARLTWSCSWPPFAQSPSCLVEPWSRGLLHHNHDDADAHHVDLALLSHVHLVMMKKEKARDLLPCQSPSVSLPRAKSSGLATSH